MKAPPLILLLALAACGRPPPPHVLPAEPGAGYEVLFTQYEDGAYADQPFRLEGRTCGDPDRWPILFAEQCRRVRIAPTRDTLHIFYEGLTVDDAGLGTLASGGVRRRLCDLRLAECRWSLDALHRQGVPIYRVCTFDEPAPS